MPFVPPQFNNLGKKAKDLFKKGYEYKNEIKVTSNASGVKLESGGYQGKSLTGYSKASWKDSNLGALEIEAHTCGNIKGSLKRSVADGIDVKIETNTKADISVETTYASDFIAATGKVAHSAGKGSTTINGSATIGFDSVSVGASIQLDAANPSSLSNFNVGTEYSQEDLTASLVTSNQGNDVTASFYQKVSGDLVLGGSMAIKPDSGSRLYTFGGEYALDKATSIKAKGDNNGIVCTSITHNLSNPSLKFTVGAQFDALGGDVLAAQKMGVSLQFAN